jgi:cadmium resistance protein CadD (predicted permease)
MVPWIALIVTAAAAYVSTNVDGYALLLGFFSNARYRAAEIVAGQIASVAIQLALSVSAMALGIVRESPIVGLLGIVPLTVGLKRVADLHWRGRVSGPPHNAEAMSWAIGGKCSAGQAAAVAAVATSSATDNVLAYAALLKGRTVFEETSIAIVLVVLTVVMCLGAFVTARSNAATRGMHRATSQLSPFVTAAIGLAVLLRFDTLPWICSFM